MRLPDAVAMLADPAGAPRVELAEVSVNPQLRLSSEDLGEGLRRLTLTDPGAENAGIIVDSLSFTAMRSEERL